MGVRVFPSSKILLQSKLKFLHNELLGMAIMQVFSFQKSPHNIWVVLKTKPEGFALRGPYLPHSSLSIPPNHQPYVTFILV